MAKRTRKARPQVKFICGACTRPLATMTKPADAETVPVNAEDYDPWADTVSGDFRPRPGVEVVDQDDGHHLTCPTCRRAVTITWTTRSAVWQDYRDGRDDRGHYDGTAALVVPV